MVSREASTRFKNYIKRCDEIRLRNGLEEIPKSKMTYYMVPEQKKKEVTLGIISEMYAIFRKVSPKLPLFFYSGIKIVQLDTTRK